MYAYNEEYFILYDRQKDEITDFYDPVYAGKMAYLDTDVYVCGDYLAFTNLRGEDKENYYAVLTLDGEEYIAPEKCDDSMVTERGNLLVRTGDQLQEIGLENRTPENALAVDQLAKAYKAESSRIAYELGMDRKGTIYEDVIIYMDDMGRDTSNNVADTWYLGGNYGTFQGTWYYPYDTKDDGVGMLQLIGDGRVIYESPVLNAQNCQVDFAVDVSGIQQLRMEYSGVAGLDKKLVGLAGGTFLSSGSILDPDRWQTGANSEKRLEYPAGGSLSVVYGTARGSGIDFPEKGEKSRVEGKTVSVCSVVWLRRCGRRDVCVSVLSGTSCLF